MKSLLSPILLFVYNRPKHTRLVLDALAKNKELKDSIIYIYCDGPKDDITQDESNYIIQTRELVKNESRFKHVNIIFQKQNKGLANSIIDGVTEILSNHDKVIVLEDDIVPEKGFLKYIN